MGKACSFLDIQHLLGSKWSLPILFEFQKFVGGKATFNQIRNRAKGKINPTLLSNTLKSFENFGLVEKFDASKIYYSLTNSGLEIVNKFELLRGWCAKSNYVESNCKGRSCLSCPAFFEKN